ncbi:ribonucleotide reductase small subunit [Gryllus bimaculatus nudivirus]|uniref:ribonucleoside-diphosphate reductase n=1 Tax=Gryllus bimaculatus nudivirus TaxID=432587 RepID=A4L226_9VIRU|nr:ribonucleotide reductase small subunit [Gryllus bimaculatus nudivirus]ABO45396.1 ribonucleotide reductase small subunit [Gryllus bimaculatus nudivirus]
MTNRYSENVDLSAKEERRKTRNGFEKEHYEICEITSEENYGDLLQKCQKDKKIKLFYSWPINSTNNIENICYNFWLKQVALAWSPEEISLSKDKATFHRAPEQLKKISACMLGMLAIGDNIVLQNLSDVSEIITNNYVLNAISRQEDVEKTHSDFYSRSLDVLNDVGKSVYYKSEHFINNELYDIQQFSKKHSTNNLNKIAFFIMICERLYFLPAFVTVAYLGITGYAPHTALGNRYVMRDENLHYNLWRNISANFEYKMNKQEALNILNEFEYILKCTIKNIFKNYSSKDSKFSLDIMLDILRFAFEDFRITNGLIPYKENKKPKTDLLNYLSYETDFNLMESTSVNYKTELEIEADQININLYEKISIN